MGLAGGEFEELDDGVWACVCVCICGDGVSYAGGAPSAATSWSADAPGLAGSSNCSGRPSNASWKLGLRIMTVECAAPSFTPMPLPPRGSSLPFVAAPESNESSLSSIAARPSSSSSMKSSSGIIPGGIAYAPAFPFPFA